MAQTVRPTNKLHNIQTQPTNHPLILIAKTTTNVFRKKNNNNPYFHCEMKKKKKHLIEI